MVFPLHIGLDPIAIQLGPLAIHWYGIVIGIGILAGFVVATHEAERRGVGRETVYSLAVWLIIFGIIGGRLYYVVQNGFGYYLTHPQDILATWQGGMAFYGTIFACAIVIGVFCYRHNLSAFLLADTLCVGLPLGQAFGRIGNIINGGIVGYPTTSPFAFIYTNPHSFIDPSLLGRPVFPASLVELLASLGIFGMLWVLRTRLRAPGMLVLIYVFAYSLSQFIVFFWRANSVTLLGLKQAQLTAIVVMAACLPLTVYAQWRYQSAGRQASAVARAATEHVPAEQGHRPEGASSAVQ